MQTARLTPSYRTPLFVKNREGNSQYNPHPKSFSEGEGPQTLSVGELIITQILICLLTPIAVLFP